MASSAHSLVRLLEPAEPVEHSRSALQPQEGWLSALLLAAMVLSTIWSIDQGHWVEGTGVLFPIALVGLVAGYLLARSRFSGWVGIPLGLVGGAVVCFIAIGQLLPPPMEAVALALQTLAGTIGWLFHPAGLPPLAVAIEQFVLNALDFGGRIGLWTQIGVTGRVSNDNAIFLLLVAYVAWIQGYLGSWGLFRLHDVVVAALPTGIALATNTAYTGQAQAPFAIFIITLLLLAVSLNLAALQQRWERLRVDYPSGLLFDVTVSSFVVICVLAVLAFFGPRLGENPLSNAFWSYMGEQWSEIENASNRLFSGVNSPLAAAGGAGRDRLVLSGPVRLSQRVVMQVQSDEPYYWRGATYDTYTGHDWVTSDKLPITRSEKQPILPARFSLRKRVRVTFEITQSRSDLIYTPDEPVALSIPYKLFARSSDASANDYGSLHAKRPAIPSLKYTVEAMTSVASAEELRNAPTDLPDWVKPYTQLPDIPQRVRDLSNQLTRGRKSNYDKAVAIEQFIRRYPFTLDVKAPPPDRDAVDYFLFDLKQGYCDYFASAMVVLLRAQGIPARLATGYVSGKFDNTTHKFIVTEEEAHSWPEVYFPNYGWMAFEPSGYRPPIVRPEQSVAPSYADSTDCYDYEYDMCSDMGDLGDLAGLLPGDRDPATVIGVTPARPPIPWHRFLLPLGALAAVAGAGLWFFAALPGRRGSTRDVVQRTYQRMVLYGTLFGRRKQPSETPLEYAHALTQQLARTIGSDGAFTRLWIKDLVGPPNGEAEMIARSYVHTIYGQRELNALERERVVEGWKELRWKLPLLLFSDRRSTRA
jgi:transglutaminase-like putative cysteine protease